MTFLEKLDDTSLKLMEMKTKFDSLDRSALLKDDLDELLKVEELLTFYINTIVEFVMEENKEFIKENKEMVKEVIANMEDFIKQVNESLNNDFFK